MARGWRRKEGAVENLELWQSAVESVAKHECQWAWVKGHAGHPQNEYANHLATRAAAQQNATDGLIESSFEQWWEDRPVRSGTRRADLSRFPDPESFVPAPPLPVPTMARRLE